MLGFTNQEQEDEILKEAVNMRGLDHPNVMNLIGVCFDKSGPCILMPFMENGSLLAHMKKERNNLVVLDKGTEQVSF